MTATASLTQNERVLRALRRGPVRLGDFLPPVCDGGATISRLGGRIYDLRRRGHQIDGGLEGGQAIYTLVREASSSGAPDPARSAGTSPGRTSQPQSLHGTAAVDGGFSSLKATAGTLSPTASRPAPDPLFELCRRCSLVAAADTRGYCEACTEMRADLFDDARRDGEL